MSKVLESATLDLASISAREQYWAYNGLDCVITYEVFTALQGKIAEAGFAYNMSRAMQAPAFTLMQRGVKISMQQRMEVLRELGIRRARAKAVFFRLCVEGLGIEATFDKKKNEWFGINPASPKQLCTLFYEILGLPEIKSFNRLTKEYTVSCDRKALEQLQREPLAKPFCELILAIRDCDKKITVLTSGIENSRIHCSYQVAGTLTGRWSSNEDPFGRGTNLQNITDEMRRVFIPDEGLKFCQLDLAQAESKLVAYLALPWGDNYLKACLSGDLHTTVTKIVWPELFLNAKDSDKDIAKRPFYRHFSYRDMAKRGGHGTNYVGSAAVIAMHLNIPRTQAETFQDKYFNGFPEIRHWHNDVKQKLVITRCIETPLGRRCFFPGRPWDNDTIKSAVAYSPQSSIGDILNLGFLNVWQKYDKIWDSTYPIEILAQVHDSILFQYAPKNESWLIPLIQRELQIPVVINGQTCRIGVDVQVGWNWGKANDANPYGLQDWKGKDDREPPAAVPLMDRAVCSFNSAYK